jgi:hypothetical protein
MIRVLLPFHLRTLARVDGELRLEIAGPATVGALLDAVELQYPVLKRRPFIRYFACQEDLSLEPPGTPLPAAVVNGTEPFLIVGAIAGG